MLWTSCTWPLIQEDMIRVSLMYSNAGREAALSCIMCVLWCLEFWGTLTDACHHIYLSYKVTRLFDAKQTRTSMTGVEIMGWSVSSAKKNMEDTAVICTVCLLWNLQELWKHFAVELPGALSVIEQVYSSSGKYPVKTGLCLSKINFCDSVCPVLWSGNLKYIQSFCPTWNQVCYRLLHFLPAQPFDPQLPIKKPWERNISNSLSG